MNGILFKIDMIRAIQENRKTVTRRCDQLKEINQFLADWSCKFVDDRFYLSASSGKQIAVKPKYKVGQIVYIKETYALDKGFDSFTPSEIAIGGIEGLDIWYKLDDELRRSLTRGRWRSPMMMPAIIARYFIQITGVSVARTRDITPDDCLKEGYPLGVGESLETWRDWYFTLYDSINGVDSHKLNWDFRYEFKRVQSPE